MRVDTNGAAVTLLKREEITDARGVQETCFTLRAGRNRMAPDGGFQMCFLRLCHDGDDQFLPTGRTVQIAWTLDSGKGAKDQTITFPALSDVPATTTRVPLAATSSAMLPVDYFVLAGPGIIQDGAFVPREIPAGASTPIAVTIGAYQNGLYQAEGGVKPTPAMYRTFHLLP